MILLNSCFYQTTKKKVVCEKKKSFLKKNDLLSRRKKKSLVYSDLMRKNNKKKKVYIYFFHFLPSCLPLFLILSLVFRFIERELKHNKKKMKMRTIFALSNSHVVSFVYRFESLPLRMRVCDAVIKRFTIKLKRYLLINEEKEEKYPFF